MGRVFWTVWVEQTTITWRLPGDRPEVKGRRRRLGEEGVGVEGVHLGDGGRLLGAGEGGARILP